MLFHNAYFPFSVFFCFIMQWVDPNCHDDRNKFIPGCSDTNPIGGVCQQGRVCLQQRLGKGVILIKSGVTIRRLLSAFPYLDGYKAIITGKVTQLPMDVFVYGSDRTHEVMLIRLVAEGTAPSPIVPTIPPEVGTSTIVPSTEIPPTEITTQSAGTHGTQESNITQTEVSIPITSGVLRLMALHWILLSITSMMIRFL